MIKRVNKSIEDVVLDSMIVFEWSMRSVDLDSTVNGVIDGNTMVQGQLTAFDNNGKITLISVLDELYEITEAGVLVANSKNLPNPSHVVHDLNDVKTILNKLKDKEPQFTFMVLNGEVYEKDTDV